MCHYRYSRLLSKQYFCSQQGEVLDMELTWRLWNSGRVSGCESAVKKARMASAMRVGDSAGSAAITAPSPLCPSYKSQQLRKS